MVCSLAVLHPGSGLRRTTKGGSSNVPRQEPSWHSSQLHGKRTVLLTVVLTRTENDFIVRMLLAAEFIILYKSQHCLNDVILSASVFKYRLHFADCFIPNTRHVFL